MSHAAMETIRPSAVHIICCIVGQVIGGALDSASSNVCHSMSALTLRAVSTTTQLARGGQEGYRPNDQRSWNGNPWRC